MRIRILGPHRPDLDPNPDTDTEGIKLPERFWIRIHITVLKYRSLRINHYGPIYYLVPVQDRHRNPNKTHIGRTIKKIFLGPNNYLTYFT